MGHELKKFDVGDTVALIECPNKAFIINEIISYAYILVEATHYKVNKKMGLFEDEVILCYQPKELTIKRIVLNEKSVWTTVIK